MRRALRYYRFMHNEKDNMTDILDNVTPMLKSRIAYQVRFTVASGLLADLAMSHHRDGRLPCMFSSG